ncbi:hypothetical protein [Luteolibacter soli]|uniref:Uncharacterized protein n=1 Tax=Luteolibacter soli TaxID=3135280 RepID=A0ABU9ASC9_9BACT
MKPNLLVMNPSGSEPAAWVEALCNQWMEDCYVYLLCPGCGFREDNARGLRFLSHTNDAVPNFGHLDAIVTFEESDAVQRLLDAYPEAAVRTIPLVGDILPDQAAFQGHPLAA